MKAGAMVALLVAAILALAVVPSAHAGRDLLGGSSSDKGKKVSIAGAEADAGAYGRSANASSGNTIVTKPSLAYSKSGSTAGSGGYYYNTVAKADGKALSKGDFAKTHTDTEAHTRTKPRYFADPSSETRSKSSAVSVNGPKMQGDSSSDKGKKVSIAGARAHGYAYGNRTNTSTDNTVVAKSGLSYSKSNSAAGRSGPSYYSEDADSVAKTEGKALAKGDFAKTHTDTRASTNYYGAGFSSKSSAVSASGRKLQGDSSSDKGKNASIAGAKAGALGVGHLAYAGTVNTAVTKPGLAYSKSGSTAGRGGYYYYTVAKADGKALSTGDFAKTHTDTDASARYHGAKSSSKSSGVSVSG